MSKFVKRIKQIAAVNTTSHVCSNKLVANESLAKDNYKSNPYLNNQYIRKSK